MTRDPLNCGACGQDCMGAACVDGACAPQQLAALHGDPAAILVDGDSLLVATGGFRGSTGALYRLPKAGGAPSVVYRGLGAEAALARSAEGILVADSGQPDLCSTDNGSGAILVITGDGSAAMRLMGRRCARSLLPRSSGLIWAEEAPARSVLSSDLGPWIATVPANAPPQAVPSMLFGPEKFGVDQLAEHDGMLFWRDSVTSIMQMPIAGGAATPIVAGPSGMLDAFAIDGDRLVYGTDSELFVRSIATGSETSFPGITKQFGELLVDSRFVYGNRDGLSVTDPVTGGSRVFALGSRYLAQDDLFIYALDGIHETTVHRMRKPATLDVFPHGDGCSAIQQRCPDASGTCTDVASDATHCGSCTNACGTNETCQNGTCACGPLALTCGGSCVDPDNDANNCGACGKTCDGASCVGGECMPVRLDAFALAAIQDATALYFSNSDVVRRLDKQTHALTSMGTFGFVTGLTADATQLYTVDTPPQLPAVISSIKKDGSGQKPLYNDRPNPRQPSVVGARLLWVEDAGGGAVTPVRLVHAAANGSGIAGSIQPTAFYTGANDDESRDVAVAGTSLYWLLGDGVTRHGAILRVDLAGATPTASLVTEIDGDPDSLVVVGDRLFVLTRGFSGVLLSVSVTGGAITLHATNLAEPLRLLAAPDGTLFWYEGTFQHYLRQLSPAALVPRAVGMDVNVEAPLTVDDTHLYMLGKDPMNPESIFTIRR